MVELGVNVDHIATLRQARRTYEPDPIWAASLAVLGGADSITIHLREDRRHIQDRDLRLLKETAAVPLNLELACATDVVDLAVEHRPDQATLVPEKREEVTTEGGLDVLSQAAPLNEAIVRLREAGVAVSLFLDPDLAQIEAGVALGVDAIELHTGQYALAKGAARQACLDGLRRAAERVCQSGVRLHAGHGLNYHNVRPVAEIPEMRELNIGHAIVARAVLVGMERAVRDMKALLL